MKLTLVRKQFRPDGVFSDLLREDGTLLAQTLEHAYLTQDTGALYAKIPKGEFTCRRGPHRLHGMETDFETFEVLDVPGRYGILFHWGNFNYDSDGCILLGNSIVRATDGTQMVTNSRLAFTRFMAEMVELDEFQLTVQ